MLLKCGNNAFEGFIDGDHGVYYYHLLLPRCPSFEAATLRTSWNLKLLLDEIPNRKLQENLTSFSSVEEFVNAVTAVVCSAGNTPRVLSHNAYKPIFEELNTIGSDAILRPDFSAVDFSVCDPSGRIHTAVVDLPSEYPTETVQVSSHQLPISRETSLATGPHFTEHTTLLKFYKQFCNLIDVFQPFWNAMEVLDSNCWVLEPEHPLLSDSYRRIMIADGCSALLTFKPHNPGQLPSIEFRAQKEQVEVFRSKLEKNVMDIEWDPEVDIHLNLLSVLELDCFPTKENGPGPEEEVLLQPGECGICFEDRLDGRPADQRCYNARCSSQYHQVCLLKYLRTNLGNVRIKNAVLGRCPTCRDTIGCSNFH